MFEIILPKRIIQAEKISDRLGFMKAIKKWEPYIDVTVNKSIEYAYRKNKIVSEFSYIDSIVIEAKPDVKSKNLDTLIDSFVYMSISPYIEWTERKFTPVSLNNLFEHLFPQMQIQKELFCKNCGKKYIEGNDIGWKSYYDAQKDEKYLVCDRCVEKYKNGKKSKSEHRLNSEFQDIKK